MGGSQIQIMDIRESSGKQGQSIGLGGEGGQKIQRICSCSHGIEFMKDLT